MGRPTQIVQTLPNPLGTGIETLPDPGVVVVGGGGIGISSVQRVSKVLPANTGSDAVTLPIPVDRSKTLLSLRGVEVENDEPQFESYLVTADLAGGGTVVLFNRFGAGVVIECFATVIEFTSGVSTQHPSITIASGATSGTSPITAVDPDRTIIIPNGVKVHGSFVAGDPDIGRQWMPWWVLTNSTLVTAFRNLSGIQLSLEATVLEFT